MTNLTIKNIPDELYHQLKQLAFEHHRSLNNEVIVNLEQALSCSKPSKLILKTARRIREKTARYRVTDKKLKSEKEKGRL